MPSIKFFRYNVRHAVVLVIFFSFFHLAAPIFRFICLLSESTPYFMLINSYLCYSILSAYFLIEIPVNIIKISPNTSDSFCIS